MNIEDIREYCLVKPGTIEEMPFGPDTLVFKVGGKIFLLVGLNQTDSLCFNVKCEPDAAIELRERYAETVVPGYHMNKRHWNTVYCNRQLSNEHVKMFIDDSYLLVYHALPKAVKEKIA